MRAIRIDRVRRPGGARARRGRAGARARRRRGARSRSRAPGSTSPTRTRATNSYLARYELPLSRAPRSRASTRGQPASASSRCRRPAATPSTPPRPREPTFPIPDGVDDGAALALLLQGLTAWHLYRTVGAAAPRARRVVVHAAAGGVGSLAVQLGTAARRRARDRHRLERGEARARARARRRRRGRRRRARTWRSALRRGQRRRAGRRRASRWPAARVFDASSTALAPFGRLVVYGIASREPNEVRTAR